MMHDLEPDLVLPETDLYYEVHVWLTPPKLKILNRKNIHTFLDCYHGMTMIEYIEDVSRHSDIARAEAAASFLLEKILLR